MTERDRRDARLLRVASTFFPATWCYIGASYAFGLLANEWQVLEGGAALTTLGGIMAAVEAVTAGALVFGILRARQWRWHALIAWAMTVFLCATLFGIFGMLPEGRDRVALLAMSLGGAAITVTIVAKQLVVVARRTA